MKIKAIVAYTKEGRVIGKDNDIPWYLPEDFKHFKTTTLNCPIIMGRKTWQSLPKTFLPKRKNMVITSQYIDMAKKTNDGISIECGPFFMPDLESSIDWCKTHGDSDSVWIIGGSQVYSYAIEKGLIEEVLATEVKKEYDGNRFFPKLEGNWESEVESENEDYQVVRYKKVE